MAVSRCLIEADADWCPHDPRGGAAVVRLSPGFSPWQAGSALKAHRHEKSVLAPPASTLCFGQAKRVR